MFSQQYLPYINAVANLHLKGAGVDEKHRLIATAVAIAISQQLPIVNQDSSRESVVSVFEQQYRISATSLINHYNEAAILDVQYAVEMVRKFWLLRCNASLRFIPSNVMEGQDFLKSWLGINGIFSAVEDELMTKHARELFVLVDQCLQIEKSRQNQK